MKILNKRNFKKLLIILGLIFFIISCNWLVESCLAEDKIIKINLTNIDNPLLGVYDPNQSFINSKEIKIEHHFVTWRLDNTQELINALQTIKNHNRFPLITLESWAWEWNNMTKETLFSDILAGKYDQTIEQIFNILKAQKPQEILFRWGHEMEIIDQYPWSKSDAKSYIQAYHYLHDFADLMGVDNLIWIWSPAGFPNATNYWVGSKYADFIGLSIYATKEWNLDKNNNKIPSFKELIKAKYWFSEKYHKPLFLAEVGVDGTPSEKSQWLKEAITNLPEFSQVKTWIYFNQIQPHIVPLKIGFPDWALDSQQVKILLEIWQNKFNKPDFFSLRN